MNPARSASSSKSLVNRLALGLLFGFVVLVGMLLISDLRLVGQAVISFPWSVYPLVILLTLFNYTLRFFKFHYYLGQIGVRGLPMRESARLFVAGFPLAVTPGKIGEALKGVWINRAGQVPVGRGLAVVFAERVSDGLAVLILSTLGAIAYPQYWPAFLTLLAGLLGIVVVSQVRPLALALLRFGERLPIIKRFVHPLSELYEGSYTLFRPRPALIAVGLGAVSWLGEGVGFYLILTGLGVAPGWTTLSIAVFILAFSTLVGAVSTLPGGLGAAEASIAGMLALLLTLPPEITTAATLLIRFATLWFGVSLGLVVWLFSKELLQMNT